MDQGSPEGDPVGADETARESVARPRLDPLVVRTVRLFFELHREIDLATVDPALESLVHEWELRLMDLDPLDRADIVG